MDQKAVMRHLSDSRRRTLGQKKTGSAQRSKVTCYTSHCRKAFTLTLQDFYFENSSSEQKDIVSIATRRRRRRKHPPAQPGEVTRSLSTCFLSQVSGRLLPVVAAAPRSSPRRLPAALPRPATHTHTLALCPLTACVCVLMIDVVAVETGWTSDLVETLIFLSSATQMFVCL